MSAPYKNSVTSNGFAYAHLQKGRTALPAINDGEIPKKRQMSSYEKPTHVNTRGEGHADQMKDRPMTQWVSKNCSVTVPGHRELQHGAPRDLVRFAPPTIQANYPGAPKPIPPHIQKLRATKSTPELLGGRPQNLMSVQALLDKQDKYMKFCDWDDHVAGHSLADLRYREAEKRRKQDDRPRAAVLDVEANRERKFRGAQSEWRDAPVISRQVKKRQSMFDLMPMEHVKVSSVQVEKSRSSGDLLPIEPARVSSVQLAKSGRSPLRESWNSSADSPGITRSKNSVGATKSSTTSVSSMRTALSHISSMASRVSNGLRGRRSTSGLRQSGKFEHSPGDSNPRESAHAADSNDEPLANIVKRHKIKRKTDNSIPNLTDPWTGKAPASPKRSQKLTGNEKGSEGYFGPKDEYSPTVASSSRAQEHPVIVTEREVSPSSMSSAMGISPLELGPPEHVSSYMGKGKAPMYTQSREKRRSTKHLEHGEALECIEEGEEILSDDDLVIHSVAIGRAVTERRDFVKERLGLPGQWPCIASRMSVSSGRADDAQSFVTANYPVPGAFARDSRVSMSEESGSASSNSSLTARPQDARRDSELTASDTDEDSVATISTRLSVLPLRTIKPVHAPSAPPTAAQTSRETRLEKQRRRSSKAYSSKGP